MNKKIMPSNEVCIYFVILFFSVMYYIGIADIQLKTPLKFTSKNDSYIKESKTNLQLPLYLSNERGVNFAQEVSFVKFQHIPAQGSWSVVVP